MEAINVETSNNLDPKQRSAFITEPARVLVVDDDKLSREILCEHLTMEGHHCVEAQRGNEALQLVSKESFELVFLDLMMPDISGYDVLRHIRQSFTLTELPVMVVTARDRSEDVVNALQLGANDYVSKPFDFTVLLARVQNQLMITRLEKSLAAQKAFSESIIDSAHETIISVDLNIFTFRVE